MTDQLSLFDRPPGPRDGLPRGFVRGLLPGTIAPIAGAHAGVPMYPESALVRAILDARTGAQP